MIYLFRFSHGDEKSELALTTRTVRRQRVIEQISSMIADYSALMLILTLIIFGKQIDKDGNLMPVETHLSTFGALIGTQVIADIVTVLIDTKVHKVRYNRRVDCLTEGEGWGEDQFQKYEPTSKCRARLHATKK